ncbi:MAG: phage protein Gp27 family protein [Deinococcota bacterium]
MANLDNYAAFQIINKRCSICQSPLRDQIDGMLLGEVRRDDDKPYHYRDIVAWAETQGYTFSPSAISRHYVNHVQPSLRTMLEVQAQIEALNEATGNRLSLHSAFANIVTSKVLRQLDKLDDAAFDGVEMDKLLRVALMAGRNSLNIERTEALLKPEEVAEKVAEGMTRKGLSPEAIEIAQREILGMGS